MAWQVIFPVANGEPDEVEEVAGPVFQTQAFAESYLDYMENRRAGGPADPNASLNVAATPAPFVRLVPDAEEVRP